MDTRLLENFLVTVQQGSIANAAKILHITQATLSRQMIPLEKEADVTLFYLQKGACTASSISVQATAPPARSWPVLSLPQLV